MYEYRSALVFSDGLAVISPGALSGRVGARWTGGLALLLLFAGACGPGEEDLAGSFAGALHHTGPQGEAMDYDEFAHAFDVAATSFWSSADAAYSTVGATPDGVKGSCWDNGPNYNRWFRFQASTDYVDVTVRTGGGEGTMQFPFLALWSDTGTELACAQFSGALVDVGMQYSGLTPGAWYYISVDNYVGVNRQGTFALSVNDQELPDYDQRATPVELTDVDSWVSVDGAYTTVGASADGARGSCWSNGPNHNRWFRFQAPTSYVDIQLRTGGVEGSLEYPFLALWDASGVELACRAFSSATSDLDMQYTNLTPGNDYYISVDNYADVNFTGRFSLSVNGFEVPDYDFKATALELTDLNDWSSGDGAFATLGATPDESRGSCWNNGPTYNRWFRFQAATPVIDIALRTGGDEGTLQFPFMALWDAAGTELGCRRFTGPGTPYSDLDIQRNDLTPGAWYYISVDNFADPSLRGTFSLSASDVVPVDYDDRDFALELTDLADWTSADGAYTTFGGTPDEAKGSCWNNGPNYNRWFRFQAVTEDVRVEVRTGGAEGTLRYPFMALWDDAGAELGCDRFAAEDSDLAVERDDLIPGQFYYVSVDNMPTAGFRGSFSLYIDNYNYDYREYALELTELDAWNSPDAAYTTALATPDHIKASCWINGPNNNRWFRFQATTNYVDLTLRTGGTEGTLQYPQLALWDADGVEMSCRRTPIIDADIDIQRNDLVVGDWYYIAVDNFVGAANPGTFALSLNDQEVIEYDYQASALELTDLNGWTSSNAAYTTVGATPDEARPSCWYNGPNYNRWFAFQASTNYIDVRMLSGGADGTLQFPLLALWDAAGGEIDCVRFDSAYAGVSLQNNGLVPGAWYYVSADNFSGVDFQGSFTLAANDQEPVSYDYRADAFELVDLDNWFSGDGAFSTLEATPDEGRASCWNSGPNFNRWFRFQAVTPSIDIGIRTGGAEGTIEYPMLALWDAAGTELACARFTASDSDLAILRTDLVPGQWYYIAVDSFDKRVYQGTFGLSIHGL